jgi:hypothetical protein
VGGGYNSTFGPQLVGGIAALFGDQLNNQQVVAVVQAQGRSRTSAGQVQYINTRRRWNWGAGAAHVPIPLRDGGLRAGRERLQHQPEPDPRHLRPDPGHHAVPAQHVAARFEFAAGASRQTVSVQTFTTFFDRFGNAYNQRRGGRQRVGEPLNTIDATAAFVGDYSVFGLTSPLAGARYRFEVSPRLGDIKYTQVTADYRRYVFLRPVTFAARGLHVGRYGGNADEFSNLNSATFFGAQPIFLNLPGFNGFIRGYDYNSINPDVECPQAFLANGSCPVLDRLIGSRVASTSIEMRIPVLAPAGLGLIPTNFLPVDIVRSPTRGSRGPGTSGPTCAS